MTLAAIELDGVLGDVVFLAITVAFFGLAWLVVRMCDHISGTADAATFSTRGAPSVEDTADAEVREAVGIGQ